MSSSSDSNRRELKPLSPFRKRRSLREKYGPKALYKKAVGAAQGGWKKYKNASTRGKSIFWIIFLAHILVLAIILIITPRRIGLFFTDVAHKLQSYGVWGMLIMFMAVVVTSHPPLFGFSGSMTLIGFTFGLWPGMLIGALGSLVGASFAFISIRLFFLKWMRQFGAEKSEKWEAFAHVVKAKGTILIVMIRWCPMPWAIGNGLFASIPSVTYPSFLLANLLVLPRLLVPVFIGSRLVSLAGEDGGEDHVKKWVNLGMGGLGLVVSTCTGLFIYRATLQKMRELGLDTSDPLTEEEEREAREILEANALLGDYEDSDEDEEARAGGDREGEVLEMLGEGRGGQRV